MPQSLWRRDEAATGAFFDGMPGLFQAAHGPENDAYQRLLYTVEHEFDHGDVEAILSAYGKQAHWGGSEAREVVAALDGMHYPETGALGRLRAVPGLDLEAASLLLHFFHHAYPIYNRDSCRGLTALGFEVPYMKIRDPAIYDAYIQCIEELKEDTPYFAVPENNILLTRIVQAALQGLGATA